MTDPAALPAPQPETKRALAGHWASSRTILATILSGAMGLPALASQLNLIPGFHLPTALDHAMLVVAVIAAWISPLLARSAGISAAAMVAESTGAAPTVREVPPAP
jgi:hypothetical protein